MAASVKSRLLNLIRETGEDANRIWSRYASERLLYRLALSPQAGDFVLKGAMLFLAWAGKPYRPTHDLDLLGYGEDSAERLTGLFRSVCLVEAAEDGLRFDPDSVTASAIREDQEYQGKRVTLSAYLGKARIPVQVDIGFGDVVTPEPEEIEFPTLLDFPAPRIRACPRETVIAEKFQALVALGLANSRMKDFYDLYILACDFGFKGDRLAQAIAATFSRRKTKLPSVVPPALTDEFFRDSTKNTQWNAFLEKSELDAVELVDVIQKLRSFLMPLLQTCAAGENFDKLWPPGGPWN